MEWATLLFFAGLFVIMQGMTELGLIDYIGRQTSGGAIRGTSHRVRATAGGEARRVATATLVARCAVESHCAHP